MGPLRRALDEDFGLETVLRLIAAEGGLSTLASRGERPATAKPTAHVTALHRNTVPSTRRRPSTAVDRRVHSPSFYLDIFDGDSPHAIIHGAWAKSTTGEHTPRAEAPASPAAVSQAPPCLHLDCPTPAAPVPPPRRQSPPPAVGRVTPRSRSAIASFTPPPGSPPPAAAADAAPLLVSPRAGSPSRGSLATAAVSPRSPARAASARFASATAPGAAGAPGSPGPSAGWAGWPATPAASGSGPPRTVECLADENLQLRRRIAELQKQLTLTQTVQRRGEAEVARLRTSLARAEEMLGQREAGTLSPNSMASQLYRTPETTSLVASLRQRLEDGEAAREDLRRELERLAKSTRATVVAELQAEALACSEETGRQLARAELLSARAAAAAAETAGLRRQLAEQAAAHAAAQARLEEEVRLLRDDLGGAATAGGSGGHLQPCVAGHTTQLSPTRPSRSDGPEAAATRGARVSSGGGNAGNPLAAGNTATLAEVAACAETLLSHAHLIDARVPLGPAHRGTLQTLEAWVRNRGPQVAGAPAVLRALRAHQGRLHAALATLPGGPIFTNAALAALTAQAARAQAAQPEAYVAESGQGSYGGGSSAAGWDQQPGASWSGPAQSQGQGQAVDRGKAAAEPRTPQPQPRPVSRGGGTVSNASGPAPPRLQGDPTRSSAAPRAPPTSAPPVPSLKLPGAAGSAARPWIPSPVAEGTDEEVESLDSVPAVATPAPNRAEVCSSPRSGAGAGGPGAASPGAGAVRLLSGRVENRSKYDVMRNRQLQHQSAPVPSSLAPGHMPGPPGGSPHARDAGAGLESRAVGVASDVATCVANPPKDDSWADLGVEEVDEDLDGGY